MNNNPAKTIVLSGTFLRLIVVLLYQHITLYPDSEGYFSLAERLMHFDLAGYEGERSPGYPLLLVMGGLSEIVAVILQMVLGVCTFVVAYKTMLLLEIKKNIALAFVLILNLYIPIIFFELAVLTEAFTLFMISLIFYFFFRKFSNEKYKVIWLTLLCSYLVLIKPFYIFLPFLLLIGMELKKRSAKYTLIFIAPLLIFLGWSYVNKVNTGYFVSTTFYGFNMAQNCVSFAEKTTPEYREIGETYAKYRDNRTTDKEEAMVIWEAYPELRKKTGLSFPDLSKKLYDYSIATIKENPASYLKQVFVSWRDFWKTSSYWEPQNSGVQQMSKPLLYIAYIERVLLQLVKIIFVLLIPYNIAMGIRRKRIDPSLIISIVVLCTSILQAFVTYGTNSRFSYPFEILILISVLLNWIQYRRTHRVTH